LGWSIKNQMFAAISAIALLFISLFAVLTLGFYDDYYLYRKQEKLIEIYQEVKENYTGEIPAIRPLLEGLENQDGVRVSVYNKGNSILYDTVFKPDHRRPNNWDMSQIPPRIPRVMERFSYDEAELSQKGYTFAHIKDPASSTEFVCIVGNLSPNEQLIVRIPVAYMRENSRFMILFLLAAGLLTLLVCLGTALLLSRKIARPIAQISDVAMSMATLEFDKKYRGTTRGEVGQLGQNINKLSDHLQSAIGELKETNSRLQAEIEKERRIDQMRREFIINVSHELKTPIALVQGYAEGLKVNINSSEEDKNYYCDIIMDEAGRMNRLVMQLLDLSRIELGNAAPELCEVDMNELTRGVLHKTGVLIQAKGLTVDFAGVSCVGWADYSMMEQVLTNYMTNAIDHTPANGLIRIGCGERGGGKLRMTVFNQGEPIAEDELPRIWDKFYKIDKARTRLSGGSGIGLSIVRAVMEAHKNEYGARNVEGGVEFFFEVDEPPGATDCNREET
jgi:two-component system sensor histidine kinase VanS